MIAKSETILCYTIYLLYKMLNGIDNAQSTERCEQYSHEYFSLH